jgi:hypothetical protein
MDKEEIFNYNYALQTCYHERIEFIKCMQLNITEQNTREKKEKKCKEFFDKYISCMKIHDNFINYMN